MVLWEDAASGFRVGVRVRVCLVPSFLEHPLQQRLGGVRARVRVRVSVQGKGKGQG